MAGAPPWCHKHTTGRTTRSNTGRTRTRRCPSSSLGIRTDVQIRPQPFQPYGLQPPTQNPSAAVRREWSCRPSEALRASGCLGSSWVNKAWSKWGKWLLAPLHDYIRVRVLIVGIEVKESLRAARGYHGHGGKRQLSRESCIFYPQISLTRFPVFQHRAPGYYPSAPSAPKRGALEGVGS